MAIQPFSGATTAQFYIEELISGETPVSPVWTPLRTTGGIPAVTRDALVSSELDGSREISSIRTGNRQIAGEYSIELSASSQDDVLAGAMLNDWVAGGTFLSIEVTVVNANKTFTRTAGNFVTDGVNVGDLIQFTGLVNNNYKPFFVTDVTPLVLTGGAIQYDLTDEVDATTMIVADTLITGNLCKTFSILTWLKGKCGSPDSYLLSKGIEFTGFTIEQTVNSMVTGSFPFIGLSQEILTVPPAGSTFNIDFLTQPFSSVDVAAFNGTAQLKLIDTFTITNENQASAQFELGNSSVAFVERGRASNTFSLAGKLYDMSLINQFLNEDQADFSSVMQGVNGSMSFTLKRADITECTPEIGGAESVTLSISGQATGNSQLSSIIIQRINI